jgi:hypothetical protein
MTKIINNNSLIGNQYLMKHTVCQTYGANSTFGSELKTTGKPDEKILSKVHKSKGRTLFVVYV